MMSNASHAVLECIELLAECRDARQHNILGFQSARRLNIEVELAGHRKRVIIRLVFRRINFGEFTSGPFGSHRVCGVSESIVRVIFEGNTASRAPFRVLFGNSLTGVSLKFNL